MIDEDSSDSCFRWVFRPGRRWTVVVSAIAISSSPLFTIHSHDVNNFHPCHLARARDGGLDRLVVLALTVMPFFGYL